MRVIVFEEEGELFLQLSDNIVHNMNAQGGCVANIVNGLRILDVPG